MLTEQEWDRLRALGLGLRALGLVVSRDDHVGVHLRLAGGPIDLNEERVDQPEEAP